LSVDSTKAEYYALSALNQIQNGKRLRVLKVLNEKELYRRNLE